LFVFNQNKDQKKEEKTWEQHPKKFVPPDAY